MSSSPLIPDLTRIYQAYARPLIVGIVATPDNSKIQVQNVETKEVLKEMTLPATKTLIADYVFPEVKKYVAVQREEVRVDRVFSIGSLLDDSVIEVKIPIDFNHRTSRALYGDVHDGLYRLKISQGVIDRVLDRKHTGTIAISQDDRYIAVVESTDKADVSKIIIYDDLKATHRFLFPIRDFPVNGIINDEWLVFTALKYIDGQLQKDKYGLSLRDRYAYNMRTRTHHYLPFEKNYLIAFHPFNPHIIFGYSRDPVMLNGIITQFNLQTHEQKDWGIFTGPKANASTVGLVISDYRRHLIITREETKELMATGYRDVGVM